VDLLTLLGPARVRLAVVGRGIADLGPLLARLTLGGVFVRTGWGKIHNLDKVASFFAELGIPAPQAQAALVAWTELVGGALLVVGLASRLASLPLAITMGVAIATAKAGEIQNVSDLLGLVEWTYLVLLAWIAFAGPGRYSLDRLVARRLHAREEAHGHDHRAGPAPLAGAG
jgi:putative oxidoreductase